MVKFHRVYHKLTLRDKLYTLQYRYGSQTDFSKRFASVWSIAKDLRVQVGTLQLFVNKFEERGYDLDWVYHAKREGPKRSVIGSKLIEKQLISAPVLQRMAHMSMQ